MLVIPDSSKYENRAYTGLLVNGNELIRSETDRIELSEIKPEHCNIDVIHQTWSLIIQYKVLDLRETAHFLFYMCLVVPSVILFNDLSKKHKGIKIEIGDERCNCEKTVVLQLVASWWQMQGVPSQSISILTSSTCAASSLTCLSSIVFLTEIVHHISIENQAHPFTV